MDYEQIQLAELFRKFAFLINLATGAVLAFCYIEFLDVARFEIFSSYYANVGLSVFLYSIVHVLMYFRVYLFASKYYDEKANDWAYLHVWVYAIVFSMGIVGFVKLSSST